MNEKSNFKVVLMFAAIAIIVFAIIYAGILLTKDIGKSSQNVSAENAMDTLNGLYNDIIS